MMMMMIVELNWPGGKMTDGPGWKDSLEIRINGSDLNIMLVII